MEETRSATTEQGQLTCGLTAYHIPRYGGGQEPLFTHFGFKLDRMVLCGACPTMHVLGPDDNIRDAAEWAYRHWKRFANGNESHTIPAHSRDELHQLAALRELFVHSLEADNENIQIRSFSLMHRAPGVSLLPEDWLRSRYGAVTMEEMKRKETRVCVRCMGAVGRTLICCLKSKAIQVTELLPGPKQQRILCTNKGEILLGQKQLLSSFGQPVQHLPIESVTDHVLPLVTSSTTTPVTSATSTPFIPRVLRGGAAGPASLPFTNMSASTASSAPARSFSAASSPTIAQPNFNISETTIEASPPSSTRVVIGEAETMIDGAAAKRIRYAVMSPTESIPLIHAFLKELAQPGHQVRTDPTAFIQHPSSTQDQVLQIFMLNDASLTPSIKLDYARKHEKDSTSLDSIIMLASSACIQMLLNAVAQIDDDMVLLLLSKLPKIAGGLVGTYAGHVATGDGDPRNIDLREFRPSYATRKEREGVLFKMIKILVSSPALPSSSDLKAILMQLEQECDDQLGRLRTAGHQNAVQSDAFQSISYWEHCHGILSCLEMLLVSDGAIMTLFCRPLVFASASASSLSSEEGEDDELTGEATTHPSVQGSSRMRGAATIRRDLGSVLSILKYIGGLRLAISQYKLDCLVSVLKQTQQEHRNSPGDESLSIQLVGLEREIARVPHPSVLLAELFGNHTSLPQLATMISRLHKVESFVPCIKNLWTKASPNRFGPVFSNGECTVGLAEWTGAVKHIFDRALSALMSLARLSTNNQGSLEDALTALVDNPSVGAFPIRHGKYGSCPRFDLTSHDVHLACLDARLAEGFEADPEAFVAFADEFRKLVWCLLDVAGTAAIRSIDNGLLRRGLDEDEPGSIYAHRSERGEWCLVAMCSTQKTGKEGLSYYPPVIGRLLLVQLDLVAPLITKYLSRKLLDHVPESMLRDRVESDLDINLSKRIGSQLLSRLNVKYTNLDPSFVVKFSKFRVEGAEYLVDVAKESMDITFHEAQSVTVSLQPTSIVAYEDQTSLNNILRSIVCREGFRLEHMNVSQYRSLSVNLRMNLTVYFRQRTKELSGDTLEFATQLLEKDAVISHGFEALAG